MKNNLFLIIAIGFIILIGGGILLITTQETTSSTPTTPITPPSEVVESETPPVITTPPIIETAPELEFEHGREYDDFSVSGTRTTTPTVSFTATHKDKIDSCESEPGSPIQWTCTVQNPGSTSTPVQCTLTSYTTDGNYALHVRCKTLAGNWLPYTLYDKVRVST